MVAYGQAYFCATYLKINLIVGSKRSEKSTPKASPRAEKEHFPTVQSPRTMMDSFRSIEHSLEKSPFQSPKSQRSIKSEQSEKLLPHSTRSQGSRDDRLMGGEIEINGRLTPTDYLVEEIMGESAVLPTCTSGTVKSCYSSTYKTCIQPIDFAN